MRPVDDRREYTSSPDSMGSIWGCAVHCETATYGSEFVAAVNSSPAEGRPTHDAKAAWGASTWKDVHVR
jgi:hypothetical protein